MPYKIPDLRARRLQEIGKIFIEHPQHGSVNRTMSRLYQTHKHFGKPETFELNRRFYRRLL